MRPSDMVERCHQELVRLGMAVAFHQSHELDKVLPVLRRVCVRGMVRRGMVLGTPVRQWDHYRGQSGSDKERVKQCMQWKALRL